MRLLRYITLYHVTKIENLGNIKREGLLLSRFKPRKENKLIGLGDTKIIYLVKNKDKLVKPLREGKECLIELKIPIKIYNNYNKIEGDPIYNFFLKSKDPLREYAKLIKKAYPEESKNKSIEDIMNSSTPFEYMSPENTVCIKEDISPKFINKIYYKL